MAGRAAITENETKPIEGCLLLNDKGQWEPATNPLNRYSTVRKGLGMQKLSPGYGFATTMLEKRPAGTVLGLVSNARGGTSIEEWRKGGKLYIRAVSRAMEAKKAGGAIKGILWHQGESDHNAPDGYAEKIKQLVIDLRQDLGDENLPLVAGHIKGESPINDAIDSLPKLLKNCAVASSKDLKAKGWHFDTEDMKELGKRFAEAMLTLQK